MCLASFSISPAVRTTFRERISVESVLSTSFLSPSASSNNCCTFFLSSFSFSLRIARVLGFGGGKSGNRGDVGDLGGCDCGAAAALPRHPKEATPNPTANKPKNDLLPLFMTPPPHQSAARPGRGLRASQPTPAV